MNMRNPTKNQEPRVMMKGVPKESGGNTLESTMDRICSVCVGHIDIVIGGGVAVNSRYTLTATSKDARFTSIHSLVSGAII